MEKEVASWPYSFPLSEHFVKSDQRGALSGQLLVHDGYTFLLLCFHFEI